MRRTLVALGFALIFPTMVAHAQVPRKKACDFLTQADISAVLGVAVGAPGDPRGDGRICQYSVRQPGFVVNVDYSDARDPDAVVKAKKSLDANTYQTATPVADIGDAALFIHLGTVTPTTRGTLTIYVGGTMTLSIFNGTLDQLRALAIKALDGNRRTGFAYNGSALPNLAKPTTPSTASASPLDQLKTDLAKKAEAGDARAALALADVYRYGNRGSDGTTKPDNTAAMYWYKNASDHGVPEAAYELGRMYHDGTAGPVNDEAAKELLTKAANAGYVKAMMPLAFIYAASTDFISKRRAGEWVLKAADANDSDGHLAAGELWEKGLLSFDDAESARNALAEYRKAADQGNCMAMMNIGGLYFDGTHAKQDAVQAQQWFGRAEDCFGKAFDAMQAQATRFRSLAAAGHLPVPPPPAVPITGSRFFKRTSPSQAPELSAGVKDIIAGVVVLTALTAAYAALHPELKSWTASQSNGAGPSTDNDGLDYLRMQSQLRAEQNFQKALGGGCQHVWECGAMFP